MAEIRPLRVRNYQLRLWPTIDGQVEEIGFGELVELLRQQCPSFQYGSVIRRKWDDRPGHKFSGVLNIKERIDYDVLLHKQFLSVRGEEWAVEAFGERTGVAEIRTVQKYGSKKAEKRLKACLQNAPNQFSLGTISRYCEDSQAGDVCYIKGMFSADTNLVNFSIGFEVGHEMDAERFARGEHTILGQIVFGSPHRDDHFRR
ncbi:hypothetical protein BV898_17096 [Hypsibius exemplaris]|uniref:Uncharacterized protein n=1 Tax=Hypsibius exemplaris TaxID=2072580 RepID=A0A9X6NG56_HYPEX|nr:hypothetical protein BV898_17096 [Hypsibius exemplaris]